MGHYKSNVRDIEFNLFEVFGTDKVLGTGPFADIDEDTARGIVREVAKLAEGPLAESFAEADRNPPVFDPEDELGDDARAVQEVVQDLAGQRVVAARNAARARWAARAAHRRLGGGRAGAGLEPRAAHVHGGRTVRRNPVRERQRHPEKDRSAHGRPPLGRDDGADRAGRRIGRGRGPYEGRSSSPTARGTSRA